MCSETAGDCFIARCAHRAIPVSLILSCFDELSDSALMTSLRRDS